MHELSTWQTCYHELFNKGWLDQIEIQWLTQEIVYHKLFNAIKLI